MVTAKNNIIVKIEASNPSEYAILNPISGSFDLMNEREYEMYEDLQKGRPVDQDFKDYLLERGYIFENAEAHEAAVSKAYDEFNTEIENSLVQLMLVPTYGCNLACTYCFQHGIEGKPTLISREIVDAFFNYAKKNFSGKAQKPFITLFGGEPLVNSPAQRDIIKYIIDKCVEEDYELAAVTNGYDLIEYIDILKKVKIKELQLTLDGSRDVHDGRRATANKKGTFDRIITGMEKAIANKMPINLRSVVDTSNIKDIVNLAEFLDSKGWLDLPPELFKTQIGRNYELFDCYAKPQHLMTQVELWGEYSVQSKQYPVLEKFHRPDFKGIRHLVDTGEMYMASFDTCPACKTEWVFDLYGYIYGCTASCGREEYLLGTYWPEVNLNNDAIQTWQKRDVTTISKCVGCKYDVICGGGCGVVAANLNGGEILSPDCRPVQELLDIGVSHYINDIKDLVGDEENDASAEEVAVSCCEPLAEEDSCCCSPAPVKTVKASSCCEPKNTEGCIICGKKLIYSSGDTFEKKCSICGMSFETSVICIDGHYVCDTCHRGDILEIVEQLLTGSSITNPVELAEKVFELPSLNMHGPEYHSIVPAVIVAAYQNLTGISDTSRISEAIRRGKDIKGGSCGTSGTCGAASGAGIAVSIIEKATPMSSIERGNAMRVTGSALIEMSQYGGPRCCKRESILSIEKFIESTDYFNETTKSNYTCTQYKKNKDCIGKKCPYYPKK